MIGRVAIVVVALLAASAAPGRAAGSIEDFLRTLYKPYSGEKAPDPAGDLAPAIFEPGLLAMIRRDRAEAHGEVGKLDYDPLCDCQDYDPLTALAISAVSQSGKTARATVSFRNGSETTTVQFQLVEIDGNWRIYDIAGRSTPSLRKLLGPQQVR